MYSFYGKLQGKVTTIHIQLRVLAYQSKALSHMLKRDLYLMGNAGLIRRDAKMIQNDFGRLDVKSSGTSHSPPSPLFYSQLVKAGEEFLLLKCTPKQSQGFRSYKNNLFLTPNRSGNNRKHPMVEVSPQVATSHSPVIWDFK